MNTECIAEGVSTREKIMQAVVAYIEEHQYPPTIREIGDMVGLRSTSSVYNHLNRLIREGKLETDATDSTPRALRVPGYKFVKE